MLQPFLLWALVAIALPSPSSQACFEGKENDCEDADFAPGSNLAGEGFDITKMERKGAFVIDMKTWKQQNNSCTLCTNPYMYNKKQKLPISVVDWRASTKCNMKLTSTVYQSSESLVDSSSSSIDNDWKVKLGINTIKYQASLTLAGSNSKLAEYSMEKTKKDKYSFASHAISCQYYSYRLLSRPNVNPELNDEFKKLPVKYNVQTKRSYYKLIDTFGTHYISKVSLGGAVRSVTSIKECEASLERMSVDEVKTCLAVEASAGIIGRINIDSEYKRCKKDKDKTLNKNSFSSKYSDRHTQVTGGHTESDLLFSSNKDPAAYKEWLSSLPEHPDVLTYSLESLHELMPPNQSTQEQLRLAIKDYILERGLWKNCSSPCKTGIKTNAHESCICSCHNIKGMGNDCCPKERGLAQITVTAVKATGLYGDYFDATDAYVKLFRNGKIFITQTSVIWNNNNPTWNHDFHLDINDLREFSSVKLEVWDRDSGWDDDLLGACNVQLKADSKEDYCQLNHGLLYYKVNVVCIPHLTGPTCSEYAPTPMSAELEKVYVSRHARPIPKEMLMEMGVLPNEPNFYFNQSHSKKDKDFKL